MTIRIIHQVLLTVSEDIAEPQKQLLFKRDENLAKQTIDSYTKQISGNFNVINTGDETYDIGDIDSPAKGLYVEVSADCSIYLSGATDPIILRLPSGPQTANKVKLFLEGDVTSLRVAADQGFAITGTYCFWGSGTT